MICIQNLVLFCQFVLKILSKNQILTSIKGRNSVANLRKTRIYNTNVNLVNDIVFLQSFVSFCQFVLKILSKTQILTSNKGRNSIANLRKTMIYKTNVDLVNDNVYTKFGQISRNSNSSKLSCMSSILARMKKIQLKIKALERSQDFSHYMSMTLKGS